jgi:hypothetical protein
VRHDALWLASSHRVDYFVLLFQNDFSCHL